MRATNPRRLVEHSADVQCRNRVSTKLKYTVSAGDAVPTISDILELGVEQVPRIEPVRVVENRPCVECLSESPNEEREVRGQRPRSDGLQGKIDAEVVVSGRNEAGVGKTNGVQGRESTRIRVHVVVQREFYRIVLHNVLYQRNATTKRVPNSP